jgi:hypothetical protein
MVREYSRKNIILLKNKPTFDVSNDTWPVYGIDKDEELDGWTIESFRALIAKKDMAYRL